jgi:hypothetical protein
MRLIVEHSFSEWVSHQESLNPGDVSYFPCDHGPSWASFLMDKIGMLPAVLTLNICGSGETYYVH